jgi:hypothetical protein
VGNSASTRARRRVAISARRLGAHTVVDDVATTGSASTWPNDQVFERFTVDAPCASRRSAAARLTHAPPAPGHGRWIRIDATVRGTSISFGLPGGAEIGDASGSPGLTEP